MFDEHTWVSQNGNGLKFSSTVSNAQTFYQQPTSDPLTAFDCCWKASQFAIASGEINPEIRVLSYPKGNKITTICGDPTSRYQDIGLSRCGTRLFSITDDIESKFCVWDVKSGQLVGNCSETIQSDCAFASFNPLNANELVTCTSDGITFWKIKQGASKEYFSKIKSSISTAEIRSYMGLEASEHEDPANFVAHCWDPNEKIYVASDYGCICQLDPSDGSVLKGINLQSPSEIGIVVHLEVLIDYIIVTTSFGHIYWLNITDHAVAEHFEVPLEKADEISYAALTPSRSKLVFGTIKGQVFELRAYVDEEEAHNAADLNLISQFHSGPVTSSTTVAPFGGTRADVLLVTVGAEGLLYAWNIHQEKLATTMDVFKNLTTKNNNSDKTIASVAASTVNPLVAVGTSIGTVHVVFAQKTAAHQMELFEIATDRLLNSPIECLEFNETSELLIAASTSDRTVFVLKVEPNGTFSVLTWANIPKGQTISSVAWMEQRQVVITSNTGQAYPFPIAKKYKDQVTALKTKPLGQVNAPFEQIARPPAIGAVIPDYALAITSKTKAVYKFIPKENEVPEVLLDQAHEKGLTSLAISPQRDSTGKCIVATGCNGGSVHLWEWTTQSGQLNPVGKYWAHVNRVTSLSFVHLDAESYCISTGADGVVHSYSISYDGCDFNPIMYCTPSTSARKEVEKAMKEIPETFLERLQALRDGKAKIIAERQRDLIRSPLTAIKEKLSQLIERNERLPAEEQLERQEFYIFFKRKEEILAQNQQQADELRHEIIREIARNNAVADRLKQAFWDSSEAVGTELCSFSNEKVVHNFPIRKLSNQERQLMTHIQLLRSMELRKVLTLTNGNVLERETCPGISTKLKYLVDGGLLHPYVQKYYSESENSPILASTLDQGSDLNYAECKLTLVDLIYHPLAMRTRKQEITQTWLIRSYGRLLKQTFNKTFDHVMELKESKLDEIKGKNLRIAEICQDLGIPDETFVYEWQEGEHPESVLEIQDSELESRPYETEAKRKQREEQEQKRLELEKLERKDDVAGRALVDMMHGTLEVKKDVIVNEVLEREPWMNELLLEEMTPEQQVEFNTLVEKERKLEEEKEKYRKALEIELKKIKVEITEICKAFDEKLDDLSQLRLFVSYSLLAQELFVLRIGQTLLRSESLVKDLSEIQNQVLKAKTQLEIASESTHQVAERLEHCRDEYHVLLEDEKVQDKTFLRQIEDAANCSIDQDTMRAMVELFKRRKEMTKSTVETDDYDDQMIYDPFREVEQANMKARDIESRYLPLDSDLDRPESIPFDDPAWKKLIELRNKRIVTENEIRKMTLELEEWKKIYEDTLAREQAFRQDYDDKKLEQTRLNEELNRAEKNTTLMLPLKQGQDETATCDVRRNVSDGYLISRSLVESLNQDILRNGKDQVGILTKIKNFRKSINLKLWEHDHLDMKMKHLDEHYTDLQLLRVTKQLQEFFKGGDSSEKEKKEQSRMEAKLEHLKKQHELNKTKLRRQGKHLNAQLSSKLRENERFQEQLQELRGHVDIRQDIMATRRATAGTTASAQSQGASSKMKSITMRRKLVDLAKQQTEEIEFLHLELDRLRRRTFPSFVQTQRHEIRDPDQV